jgi:integrase
MRGSIRKRGNGWQISVPNPIHKGHRIYRTVSGSKKFGEGELAKLVAETQQPGWCQPSKLTVGEWIERFLADYAPLLWNAKQQVLRAQTLHAHWIPPLGDIPLVKLTSPDIQRVLGQMRNKSGGPVATSTKKTYWGTLHSVLTKAEQLGFIQAVPKGVELGKVKPQEPRALSQEEEEYLLGILQGTDLYLPAYVALGTGMRRMEVLGLHWEDIQGNLIYVRESKTAAGKRKITVHQAMLDALKEHHKAQAELRLKLGRHYLDRGLVFPSLSGAPQDLELFSQRWAYTMKKAGLDWNFHELRHTHVSRLIAAGVDMLTISKRVGHTRSSFTMDTYGHLLPGQDERAAEVMGRTMK